MIERTSYLTFICSAASGAEGCVYSAALDARRGELTPLSNVSIENPSFLAIHPNRELLYVVSRASGGQVWVIRIEHETGELVPVTIQKNVGEGPCYVSIDATGSYVFVAAYRGGTVAVVPTKDDGQLNDVSDIIRHRGSGFNQDRQDAPHPHSIGSGPENHFVYVPDLGIDQIVQYRLDREYDRLRIVDSFEVEPGTGPRHFAFHPSGQFGYVTNELNSTLTAFKRTDKSGSLEEIETVSTIPGGFDGDNAPADVHVHPSGKWVYASNRGHDSVVHYTIDETTGRLDTIDYVSTHGRTPRELAIDPSGTFLFCANIDSDSITIFRINQNSGAIGPLIDSFEIPKPICVKFTEQI